MTPTLTIIIISLFSYYTAFIIIVISTAAFIIIRKNLSINFVIISAMTARMTHFTYYLYASITLLSILISSYPICVALSEVSSFLFSVEGSFSLFHERVRGQRLSDAVQKDL